MAENEIFETQDGSHSIQSKEYGVSYHSKYGAIQESLHVFIKAGLRYRLAEMNSISVLEIGFGTGLNALLTLAEAEKTDTAVYYEAIEAYPIPWEQARVLNYPELTDQAFRPGFLKMHEMDWGVKERIRPHFTFKKQKLLFQEIDFPPQFDVIYFDAFAPNAQPELWEAPLLQKMYDALREKGVLVTYCAKGAVKRTLKSIGFTIESIQGPPGKREMTRAVK
jgi:tRNA U34 5-methylaminomethyl-2-thiouridine-forming methyltransferase MnmC